MRIKHLIISFLVYNYSYENNCNRWRNRFYNCTGRVKKKKDLDLNVIVGMMDDGGSNAVVRDEFGLLPLK